MQRNLLAIGLVGLAACAQSATTPLGSPDTSAIDGAGADATAFDGSTDAGLADGGGDSRVAPDAAATDSGSVDSGSPLPPPTDAATDGLLATPDVLEASVDAALACPSGHTACGTTCCPSALDLGVYNWNIDTTAWTAADGDILNWGAATVTGVGAASIRVYLGTNDIYQLNGGTAFATPLAAAQAPAYATLFANPAITTYFLTTYTASDQNDDWFAGYSAAQIQAETAAIVAVASYLVQTYPTKTFVLQNWEGDNAISTVASTSTAWSGMLAWIQSRIAGVRQAQAANPTLASHLGVGLEFNYTSYPTSTGNVACGTGATDSCVVSRIAPNVAVDFYSYSSWQSLAGPEPQLTSQVSSDLATALAFIRDGQPNVVPSQIIAGELGSARDIYGECAAAQRTADTLAAVKSFGSAYAFFWQAGDNPANQGPYVGFGLQKYDGSSSLLQKLLKSWFSTDGSPVVPSSGCSSINTGGVVNGTNYSTTIPAGSTVAIFGASFAGTGDVVHLWANGMRYTIAAGSPYFYDAPGQINATLPAGVTSSEALVYVTSGTGVDSNGQLIAITP